MRCWSGLPIRKACYKPCGRCCLTPGGALSLMFYNANGFLMHNMVLGNFRLVDPRSGGAKKKKRTLSPDYPRDPQQVYGWLEAIGWQIVGKTGVRVFHDYLREDSANSKRACLTALLALEQHYCRQEPYVSFGRYIHVTAHKPQLQGQTMSEFSQTVPELVAWARKNDFSISLPVRSVSLFCWRSPR